MDQVVKITDHFWVLEDAGVRAFLFEGEERAMLVDTGFGQWPLREMVSELTTMPVFLVNTHSDRDHIGGNRDFRPVYMHPAEMERYKNGLPEGCSMEDVRPLWEGDVIDLGRWRFEVLLTPGHTPGSIMLLEREKRMLLSGDSVQSGAIYMFGPGRNIQAFQHSLEKIETMAGEIDTIWPSHDRYPLTEKAIPDVLQGTRDLLAGKGMEQEPPRPMPCKKYVCKTASFLYCFKEQE